MKYYIFPVTEDGFDTHYPVPISPKPIPLHKVAEEIENFLLRYIEQGYYPTRLGEECPLDQLPFRLVPEKASSNKWREPDRDATTTQESE